MDPNQEPSEKEETEVNICLTEDVTSSDSIQQYNSLSSYTVDEAINGLGFGAFQILITFFCGLMKTADAMELMMLSVLSPLLKCQWNLTDNEEALVTFLVFAGVFCGGLFWGVLCDMFGRKKILLVVDIGLLIFGVMSALKLTSDDSRIPGYPWLLLCRFFVGFNIAGALQVITYYIEFLPLKRRGVFVILLELWWSAGSIFGSLLAAGVLGVGHLGWHWYLGLTAFPLALDLLLFPFVPESARYYLVKGKHKEAMDVIKQVARMNGKNLPPGELVLHEEKEKRKTEFLENSGRQENGIALLEGDVVETENKELQQEEDDSINENESDNLIINESTDDDGPSATFHKPSSKLKELFVQVSLVLANGMWKTTVLLALIWLGTAWIYFGTILLTTSMLKSNPHCSSELNSSMFRNESFCEEDKLNSGDYFKISWIAAAEIPGILVTGLVVDFLGRKGTMAAQFVVCMVGFLLLFLCTSDVILTVFMFILRAFSMGIFMTIVLYTPEVYPTKCRALGLGICNSAARIGGMITPYVAQVLFFVNDYIALSLYAGSCLLLAVLSLLLPIETKGRALRDLRRK